MARITVDFHSQVLGLSTSIAVVLPDPAFGREPRADDKRVPMLYLLHGLSDDHTIWLRRTSVERYAAAYGLGLVIPEVARSYYTDMASGLRYWTYVSEELPFVVGSLFRTTAAPERTFVAGLSMGGYGALKLALSYPERFAAVGSFSGAVDPERLIGDATASDDPTSLERAAEFFWIFGDPPRIAETDRDLFHLAATARRRFRNEDLPGIYISCGTEDFLIEHNRRLHSHLDRLAIPLEYREEPGTHEWGFWDRHVLLFIEWLEERGLVSRRSG